MRHCKNCLSENVFVLQTTPDYSLIKCNDCLFIVLPILYKQ